MLFYRTALCKIGLSNHHLAVESGRWHKPLPIPLNERKCMSCDVFEDEFDFMFECSMFTDLMKKYIPKFNYN